MKLSTGYSTNKAEHTTANANTDKPTNKSIGTKRMVIPTRKIWPLVLVLVSCCYLIVSGIILSVLWDVLADYEKTLPQNIADKAAQTISNGDYSLILDSSTFKLSKYEDETIMQEYLSKYMRVFLPLKALYRREKDGVPAYSLVSKENNKPLVELLLVPTGEFSPYGRPLYRSGTIVELDSNSDKNNMKIFNTRAETIINAPKNISLQVNGKPYLDKPTSDVEIEEYASLVGQAPSPRMVEYKLSGLLLPPEVTISSENEDSGSYILTANDDMTAVTIARVVDNETKAVLSKLAEEASLLHARIITKDATFSMISPYLLRGSRAYNSLVGFDNRYYGDHDSYHHKDMVISDFKAYDKNRISCVVTFDYYVKNGKRENHYPTYYTVFFTRASAEEKFLISQVRPY